MKMVVKLEKLVQEMNLKNLTPEVDMGAHEVIVPDINRPALQLAGFFDHFASERVQIIGYVEYTYMQTVPMERKEKIYDVLMGYGIPCFIFCRGLQPGEMFLEKAKKNQIPVFITESQTSSFSAELIRWLKVELAPRISIHGVLVDVYGVGVLIMGESGIGKSETALELIKRGHRLVTDDVVEIHKVGENELIGTSPDITRHLIELRGVGIIDVKMLYGVQSVLENQRIDLVVTMEEWNKDREYDRLGLEDEHTEVMGTELVCHTIPVRPGRNLALIVETAAVNHRQKTMGYNAAQELYRRVQENLQNRGV